jgi:hypothetical protein
VVVLVDMLIHLLLVGSELPIKDMLVVKETVSIDPVLEVVLALLQLHHLLHKVVQVVQVK